MKALDKIYLDIQDLGSGYSYNISLDNNGGQEYIRKDIVDETVKTAEDHAYFAGQEKLREKLLEWAKEKADDYKQTANIRRSFEMMIRKIESL